jgi:hypothetical protein
MEVVGSQFPPRHRAQPQLARNAPQLRNLSALAAGPDRRGSQRLQAAEKADPRSPSLQFVYRDLLISAERYKQAAGHCQRSSDVLECQGRILLAEGRIDDSIKILMSAPNTRYLGYADGRAGRRQDVEK